MEINNRRIDELEAELKKLREDLNNYKKSHPSPCKVSPHQAEDNHCEPNVEERRDLAIVPSNELEKVLLDVDRKLLYTSVTSQRNRYNAWSFIQLFKYFES